jgi:signal transduction histidine kinase
VHVADLPAIEGDPLQLRQLLQNLISNALKFHQTDTPPQVRVYTKHLDGKIQLIVEDEGIGFKQEEAERIFQPFHRLVGRTQYEGSGIGLAICRRIVERHTGNISVVSAEGQGTKFIITLPIRHAGSATSG